MTRVLIADDHTLVRQGIRLLLEREPDIEVVAEADDGTAAVEMAKSLLPDVAIMDVTMPGLNGIEAAGIVTAECPTVAVVILSMHADESMVRAAVDAGARGYVLKGSVADELLLAMRAATRGATYLSKLVTDKVITRETPTPTNPDSTLTPREREILGLIGEGLTNRAIAGTLGLSTKTVERHRTNMMSKLDVHTVVELVRAGIRSGAITLDG